MSIADVVKHAAPIAVAMTPGKITESESLPSPTTHAVPPAAASNPPMPPTIFAVR